MRIEKTLGFLLADLLMGGLDVTPNFQILGNTAGSQSCFFSTGFVSLCSPTCLKLLRLLPLELYGSIYTDFNNMMKRKKGSTFSYFLPQSASFLPACVSVNTESRDSKGTLPFIPYMLLLFPFFFSFFFSLWLVEDTCVRYRLYNLRSLKQVFKKARNVSVSEGSLQSWLCKSSFSITSKKSSYTWPMNKQESSKPLFWSSYKLDVVEVMIFKCSIA